MGDRVAVIKKGLLQQADPPQTLYERPVNLFVAGFIGSPAMNMAEAEIVRTNGMWFVQFGGHRLRVDDEVLEARPALQRYEGDRLVVGIRPEDMEDASLVAGAAEDRRIPAVVGLREALGSEVLVHFTVKTPPVLTEDTKELAVDVGTETLQVLEERARQAQTEFVARLNPRTKVQEGERIEVFVDTRRLHFFDVERGLGVYDDTGG